MKEVTPFGMSKKVSTSHAGMTRFAALRREIMSSEISFLMEAHDGLSAKIVEEAGFRGVWASGLTTSAALGLRDSNEASWTQVLDQLEYMADATRLPILVDGDTGHGNFNNVRRFVRKLGERGLAGVCIEDKLFPKTNSFIGEGQALADIEEFCGRIKAGKDSQVDDDFVLIARVEALISGLGMAEALRRAEAYHQAGADAILIHSKRSTAEEILAFTRAWGNRAPLVIVPTMYYATPTAVYREAGISTVIWANHLLRSALVAMRETAARIAEDESLMRVEGQVASVQEVFRLVGNAELEQAERQYLPARPSATAVVLAASGGDLGTLTVDRPKCMLDVRGRPLLGNLVHTLRESGVRDVTVVRGYRKEAVRLDGVRMVDNDRHAETGELWSLACAREAIRGETVITYGDVLFRRHILDGLLRSEADVALAVDSLGATRRPSGTARDLVVADRPFSGDYLDDTPAHLRRIATDIAPADSCGEWMGLFRVSARGAGWLREEMTAMEAEGLLEAADLPLLLTRMAARHPVQVLYFAGHWLDIDTLGDLAEARNLG
ncbi:phosphoenolpyruvate mutase [Belnapia rosea]|uniref:phosphoenolpyruvate mutase n=1 Tax=Belnapia rosea TaxID=938405 RepID=A0A1G6STY9_9PROT|nr:phosphoenolpyruvate mutase [Belnapia rosea]SDD20238.1 phosphoenolpyruvate mutase [Belnapia rosea]